jgi:uroporphyrinogen-III synthase
VNVPDRARRSGSGPRPELGGHDLGGWRVVVTREAERAEELASALQRAGGLPVLVPVLHTVGPADDGALLDAALAGAGPGDWLLLTSAATVAAVSPRLRAGWSGPVAVVGPATAAAARRAGLVPSVALDGASATVAGLADLLAREHGPARALAPGSDLARPDGAEILRAAGWEVDAVVAYRTVALKPSADALRAARDAAAITFLSPSAVRAWMAVAARDTPALVVTIGPTTSRQATRSGLDVSMEAARHDVTGVVEALLDLARDVARSDSTHCGVATHSGRAERGEGGQT